MERSMQNFVSVIIPVYNREIELKRAIKSVLNQSFQDFEIIVIDDGSSIDIKRIIEEFNSDRLVYLRNEKNKGISFSRNRGISLAKGDLIAFLDSDDEWLKDKLKKQIEYLNNTQYRIVHTEEIWIRNGKRVNPKKRHTKSGGNIFIQSLELCLISPSSVLIKKEIFEEYGLFDEDLLVCEDYDLWLRITAKEEVGFIKKPLIIKYGGHSDQLSRKYEAMDKFRVKSLIKLLNTVELNDYQKKAVIETIINKSNILYNGAIKRGKVEDAEIYKKWLTEISK
ncbi:MAG TPA: glycosyltransferase [Spirochaetota bacterium]|nr:glycosyltransferase [Spirochaetota bacterium]HOL56965.1 glycosyltransferase [Spirochaetota bacterium]HPP04438.1 glycosyltransferase [Spirochaetota bacterium]